MWTKRHFPGGRLLLGGLGLAVAAATLATELRAADAKAKASKGGNLLGQAGSLEFAFSGQLDLLASNAEVPNYVEAKIGYFLLHSVELGFTALEGTTPSGERNTMGLFGEYDWTGWTTAVPSAGINVAHTDAPVGNSDNKDGRIVSLYGGLSLPLAANIALGGIVTFAFADHEVLGYSGDRTDKQLLTTLQMRLFF